ncbi:uncharacterized protein BKA78DRAFT_8129 [Phyllosticta capitalensis]|uniref:uncharacterized protein n=1 Tax=Phyllosticta capitalensis TaxID=121624 RepID=UPI0031328CF9
MILRPVNGFFFFLPKADGRWIAVMIVQTVEPDRIYTSSNPQKGGEDSHKASVVARGSFHAISQAHDVPISLLVPSQAQKPPEFTPFNQYTKCLLLNRQQQALPVLLLSSGSLSKIVVGNVYSPALIKLLSMPHLHILLAITKCLFRSAL